MARTKVKKEKKLVKINLGCGIGLKAGYINVDKFYRYEQIANGAKTKEGYFKNATVDEGAEYIQADILDLPFPDSYADLVELHQVIEHFGIKEVIPALKEIYRVLKPGGRFIMVTPNFTGIVLDWLAMQFQTFDIERYFDITEQMFGNQNAEGELHKCPMSAQFLQFCLGQAGFKKGIVKIFGKGQPIPKDDPSIGLLGQSEGVFRMENIVMDITK